MLLGSDRAIVTPVAGTTRDLISDVCDVAGLPVTLVDTAGLRDANDHVEREGVARATHAAAVADVALLVYDASAGYQAEDRKGVPPGVTTVLVANKCDLGMQDEVSLDSTPVQVSALSGEGFDELRTAIVKALVGCAPSTDTVSISNERHITLLELTRAPLVAAATAVGTGASEEFVLADLYAARDRFDEILGRRTSEDMLRHIFGRFCIGK
jgi:tRNA modification GTPase